jgi:hypothetical protein
LVQVETVIRLSAGAKDGESQRHELAHQGTHGAFGLFARFDQSAGKGF